MKINNFQCLEKIRIDPDLLGELYSVEELNQDHMPLGHAQMIISCVHTGFVCYHKYLK